MGIQAKEGPHGKAQECERALGVTRGLRGGVSSGDQNTESLLHDADEFKLVTAGHRE